MTSYDKGHMTVARLVAILDGLPPEMKTLPIATYANNHSYHSGGDARTHGIPRVMLAHHYRGDHVLIGNMWHWDLCSENHYIKEPLDGGEKLPSAYGEGK